MLLRQNTSFDEIYSSIYMSAGEPGGKPTLLLRPGHGPSVASQVRNLDLNKNLNILTFYSPVVNTGKIFVNICVGRLFGERPLSSRKILGLLLLLCGILLQLTS